MSGPFGSSQFMYATGALAEGQSLRFEDGDSPYLSWTPASAGNRKTWTWSGWVKRGNLTSYQRIFQTTSTYSDSLILYNNDTLVFWGSDASTWILQTSAVFRDPSAWYHIVVSVDTTQATASDRMKIYVNNELETLSTATYPSQNTDCLINNTQAHYIGTNSASNQYLDGYLANVTFIDGQALTPASFGEYDDTLWKPKSDADITSLTFATNGFYLNFEDSSAIGDDTSGNANDWTVNNLVATDVVLDSPVSGGNFATLNPLDFGGTTLKEGNLETSSSANGDVFSSQQVPNTGKWYFEFRTSDVGSGYVGVMEDSYKKTNYSWGTANVRGKTLATTTHYPPTTDGSRTGIAMVDGDIGMCAIDMDNGKIWWGVNGTWASSGDPAAGTNQIYSDLLTYGQLPLRVHYGHSSTTASLNFNFGQDSSFAGNETPQGNTDGNGAGDFYYAPPSAFLCLKTSNLPTPTITAPDEYFNTVLYAGNNTTGHAITAVGHQPDWTWIKLRNGASGHRLVDAVRGVTKYLDSTGTSAETTNTDRVTSFDSDGFTLGNSATVNGSFNYVAWNWLAGNGTSSNTDGDQTTTISANPTAGFSVGTFTAPSSYINFTTGHGLSAAPEMVIKKRIDSTSDWWVWHKDLPNAATGRALKLNLSSVEIQGAYFDQSNMTTTTVGYTAGVFIVNGTYLQYVFHSVESYSKCGVYTGNGSSNGVYVHCGFRPAWVMVKAATGSVQHWWMFDNKREGYNVDNDQLYANLTSAEGTSDILDFTSNGFKLRNSTAATNGSGQTFIFLAFAEAPFKSANAR